MNVAIPETEIPQQPNDLTPEEVANYVELWKLEGEVTKKFDELKESLIPRLKAGAKVPTLENGITLVFKNSTAKSTSYQSILNKVKEWVEQQAAEGQLAYTVLLGYIKQWYMENTKESERNTITPKIEQVITVTKAVKLKKGGN